MFGLSTQNTEYQKELAYRLYFPYLMKNLNLLKNLKALVFFIS